MAILLITNPTFQEEDGSPSVANVHLIKVTNGKLTDHGDGSVSIDLTGTGGGDATAIHVNAASEISGITEKTLPVTADLLVMEDSANSNNKKKLKAGNLFTMKEMDPINASGRVYASHYFI